MGYVIEKGVPIPESLSGGKTKKYPFLELEVGDSFLIEFNGQTPTALQNKIVNNFSNYSRYHGTKYTSRIKRDEGGVRVWRIE